MCRWYVRHYPYNSTYSTLEAKIFLISQIGQIPLAHKFLLGNPLLPKLIPSIEKTNQVLQFSLAQLQERQKNPVDRKDILNQLLDTHRTDPDSLTIDEIIAITTTNVLVSIYLVLHFLKTEHCLHWDAELQDQILLPSRLPRSFTTSASTPTRATNLKTKLNRQLKVEGLHIPLHTQRLLSYRTCKTLIMLSSPEKEDLTYNAISRTAVINESMRIHPATGFILERRVPKHGVTLHDIHLPEDTVVGVNSWVLHRNKDVFGEDVHSFRPERWIDGDEGKIKEMRRNLFTVSEICIFLFYYYCRVVYLDWFRGSLGPDLEDALARISRF